MASRKPPQSVFLSLERANDLDRYVGGKFGDDFLAFGKIAFVLKRSDDSKLDFAFANFPEPLEKIMDILFP